MLSRRDLLGSLTAALSLTTAWLPSRLRSGAGPPPAEPFEGPVSGALSVDRTGGSVPLVHLNWRVDPACRSVRLWAHRYYPVGDYAAWQSSGVVLGRPDLDVPVIRIAESLSTDATYRVPLWDWLALETQDVPPSSVAEVRRLVARLQATARALSDADAE